MGVAVGGRLSTNATSRATVHTDPDAALARAPYQRIDVRLGSLAKRKDSPL